MVDSEAWQRQIEEENRAYEEEEYRRYSSLDKSEPLTEKEFDDILAASEVRYNQALKDGKAGYCSAYDFYWNDINEAARSVNPGEWYKVWLYHHSEAYINKFGHTVKWMRQADYLVNKALACGIAKTAEEAAQYFKDNK